MSSETVDVQNFINDCDSLQEISNVINKVDNKNYKIHKEFFYFSSFFDVEVANIDDIQNSDILCTNNFGVKMVSVEVMKNRISRQSKMSLELVERISLNINDDTEKFSEDDKIYLAKKYSSFLEFLLDHCPNAIDINISYGLDKKIDVCFVLLIFGNLNSTKIKKISTLDFDAIVTYANKYNFSIHDIFGGLLGLSEIFVSIKPNEFLKNLSDIDNAVKNFLNYINKFNGLVLCIRYDEESKDCIVNLMKILDYGEAINLNIKVETGTYWCTYLKKNNFQLDAEVVKIKDTTDALCIFIENTNDLKIMKVILKSFYKLQKIIIYVEGSLITEILEKCKTFEEAKLYVNEFFNYRGSIENLTNVRISFGRYYHSSDEPNAENFNLLHKHVMNSLISILPPSIDDVLHLSSTENFTLEFFEKISVSFPSLRTISFLLCENIPKDALFKIPSLKNVVFNGERKVNIPPWVETVMYLYFDSDFYYPNVVESKKKSNEHYYDLVNQKFDMSLRCVNGKDIFYIAFLKNFDTWREFDNLESKCY